GVLKDLDSKVDIANEVVFQFTELPHDVVAWTVRIPEVPRLWLIQIDASLWPKLNRVHQLGVLGHELTHTVQQDGPWYSQLVTRMRGRRDAGILGEIAYRLPEELRALPLK